MDRLHQQQGLRYLPVEEHRAGRKRRLSQLRNVQCARYLLRRSGGGRINIVNNYYKAGPSQGLKETTLNGLKVDVSTGKERGSQDRITLVTLSNSGNSDKNHPELYDMTSRYFINGNTTETTKGSVTQNKD